MKYVQPKQAKLTDRELLELVLIASNKVEQLEASENKYDKQDLKKWVKILAKLRGMRIS